MFPAGRSELLSAIKQRKVLGAFDLNGWRNSAEEDSEGLGMVLVQK